MTDDVGKLVAALRACRCFACRDEQPDNPHQLAADMLERINSRIAWQPISTAPRDGTGIIYKDEDGEVSTCAWIENDFGYDWYDPQADQICYPRLWTPLPRDVNE